MSNLRERMSNDMQLHGFAQCTQQAYLRTVRQLQQFYNLSPQAISEERFPLRCSSTIPLLFLARLDSAFWNWSFPQVLNHAYPLQTRTFMRTRSAKSPYRQEHNHGPSAGGCLADSRNSVDLWERKRSRIILRKRSASSAGGKECFSRAFFFVVYEVLGNHCFKRARCRQTLV